MHDPHPDDPHPRTAATGPPRVSRFAEVDRGQFALAVSLDLPVGVDPDRADGTYPTVIVTHGHTGDKVGRSYKVVELGRRLAAEGIVCVRFDQSGCGESGGRFEEVTLSGGVADVTAVTAWATDQTWCDAERIAHLALSMGSLLVVSAEAERSSRGIVMWAPVYDLRTIAVSRGLIEARPFLESRGWFPYKGLRVGAAFAGSLGEVDMSALLGRSESPILVMHSPEDETVDFAQAEALVARCGEVGRPCELRVVEGADHDFHEYPHRQVIIGATVEFMKRQLLR